MCFWNFTLKFYTSEAEGFKAKVRKFLELIATFGEVAEKSEGKVVGRALLARHPE